MVSEQLERYASLVERVRSELAALTHGGVIDSTEMLEDTVRRLPVELPIDPTCCQSNRRTRARLRAT